MLINHIRFLGRRLKLARNTQKILQAGNMAEWTFVSNHAVVLSFLSHHTSITAREVATRVGITERAVRKIINDLETGGYILKVREGRRVNYSVRKHLPLRHRTQQDKSVGDLLKVLGLVKKAPRTKAGRGHE